MTDREQQIELEQAQAADDARHVMSTPQGRRFMWRLLKRGNIFRKCFTGNSHTFYEEGKRELTLETFHEIMEACPEQYWQAVKENQTKMKEHGNG